MSAQFHMKQLRRRRAEQRVYQAVVRLRNWDYVVERQQGEPAMHLVRPRYGAAEAIQVLSERQLLDLARVS